MCVVSNIGDSWKNNFPNTHPWTQPYRVNPNDINPNTVPYPYPYPSQDFYPDPFPNILPKVVNVHPTLEEFEALKKEVEELKLLLQAAKRFDEATNQKDCEMDEKVEFIKKIADFVGVDMKDVLK